MQPHFWVGLFSMWEVNQALQAGYDFVLHSASRATVHVQPLHPWCMHSTFLSEKVNSPCWGSRLFWQKKNKWSYVYNSILTRQICAISSSLFCKPSFWLSSALHHLSNPKRILHYKSFESGLAPTKPTQMLLPKLLQPVQAKSGKLHS